MKLEQKLKVTFVILLIILISLISLGGIFIQKAKFVENIIPDYKLGMDLTGSRLIELGVSTSKNKVIYDKEGKVVTEEGEGTTTKEEPVNPEETLTKENYEKSKQVFEQRLKEMKVANYELRFDENTGKVFLRIPENVDTDTVAQYTAIKGVFEVTNEEEQTLLNNSHIKKAQVVYGNSTTGTTVYLTIQFNKEGTEILKDITNTYIKTTNEEGKEQTKTVNFKIDDTTLINTYFDKEIVDGKIQLSIGKASTSSNDISQYIKEASSIAVLLNTNSLPITYTIERNTYVMSDITQEMFLVPMIVLGVILTIGILFLMIRYGKNGFLTAISFVGYIAVLLLALRYFNVVITLEGMIGIIIAIILNYIFSVYLLHLLKNNKTEGQAKNFKEAMLKALFILVPVTITVVIFCFAELLPMAKWQPISSFGMTIFWGIFVSFLYHLVFTRTLLVETTVKK